MITLKQWRPTFLVVGVVLAFSSLTHANGNADQISSCSVFEDYKDNGNGTLTDPRTGLVWQVCDLGQIWADGRCNNKNGRQQLYAWYQAMTEAKSNRFLGATDWRLPTSSEFRSAIRADQNCVSANTKKVSERLGFSSESYSSYFSTALGTNKDAHGGPDAQVLVFYPYGISGPTASRYRDEVGDYRSYARLVRSGLKEDISEFEREYQRVTNHQGEVGKETEARNMALSAQNARLQEQSRAYAAREAEFQKNIKAGDEALLPLALVSGFKNRVLVLEVKGDILRIQDAVGVQKWIKRSVILALPK